MAGNAETAFLAAGCFWGVQAYYDDLPGVLSTQVGYTGGRVPNPTYKQVCTQTTGHAETTKITFDPTKISYHDILEHFFRMHNPTTPNQDGPNIGTNYRSAIFYVGEQQHQQAQQVIDKLTAMHKFKSPIITEVSQAGPFYLAEEYHQKYFQKTGQGACHVWPSEVDITMPAHRLGYAKLVPKNPLNKNLCQNCLTNRSNKSLLKVATTSVCILSSRLNTTSSGLRINN